MVNDTHYIAFSQGITFQILSHNFILTQDFHSQKPLVFISFPMNQKNFSKRPLSKQSMIDKILSCKIATRNHLPLNSVCNSYLFRLKLFVLTIFLKAILIEYFFQRFITAVMYRSHTFLILFNLAFSFQEKIDDFFVAILSSEMKSSVSVVITGISINFIIKKCLHNFNISSKCSNMKPASVEFCHSIQIDAVRTKKSNNVIVTFIAGVVQWAPIIKSFPVDLNRIPILSFLNNFLCFIIMSLFTVLPQLLIVFMNLNPEIIPIYFVLSYF